MLHYNKSYLLPGRGLLFTPLFITGVWGLGCAAVLFAFLGWNADEFPLPKWKKNIRYFYTYV